MMPQPTADRPVLRAALYGLWLRHCGYAADKAAILVSQRYPRVEKRLRKLATRAEREQHEAADAAAGGMGC